MKYRWLVFLLLPLYMFSCLAGILKFSDASIVQDNSHEDWVEYVYVSTGTGRRCGDVYSGKWTHPDGRATGFSYPTQWWNFSHLKGKDYESVQEARKAVEKFCPLIGQ